MTFPKVWQRFTAKQQDGTELNLRIQNLPRDRIDDALDFYTKFMLPEESFYKAAGVCKNADAIAEVRTFLLHLAQKPTVVLIICCRDDSEDFGDIIGISVVELEKRNYPNEQEKTEPSAQTEEVKNLNKIMTVINKMHSSKDFDLDLCWYYIGICVHSRYRGLGIAQELLKTRYKLCEEYNVPMTKAWMTSVATQKAAARLGWKTSFELPAKELAKLTELDFVGAPDVFKAMYIEFSKKNVV